MSTATAMPTRKRRHSMHWRKTATLFTQAFTPSPITQTSHTTILTGLLPIHHGVTDFGTPLAAQHPTLATLLKPAGYKSAAFIGSVVLDSKTIARGLDRGFDFYDNFPAQSSREVALGPHRTPCCRRRAARRILARRASRRTTLRVGASLRSARSVRTAFALCRTLQGSPLRRRDCLRRFGGGELRFVSEEARLVRQRAS